MQHASLAFFKMRNEKDVPRREFKHFLFTRSRKLCYSSHYVFLKKCSTFSKIKINKHGMNLDSSYTVVTKLRYAFLSDVKISRCLKSRLSYVCVSRRFSLTPWDVNFTATNCFAKIKTKLAVNNKNSFLCNVTDTEFYYPRGTCGC